MFLAMAILLLHPQIAATATLSAAISATEAPAAISDSSTTSSATGGTVSAAENSALSAAAASVETASQPAAEPGAELPDAPVLVAVASPGPLAFVKSGKPLTVSVAQLQAENRRREMMWKGLTVATSGAAMFDAISTRHAITTYGAVELNPLLKPFAGNSSLFAAIQVAPALLDFAGKKMMYSRHTWLRRTWFVPQGASFVSSILCGAHNLSYR